VEVEVVEVVELGAEVDVVEVVVEQEMGVAVDVVVVVVVEIGTVLATEVCCFRRKSAKPSLKVFTFSSCSATHTTTTHK
jgi:hypothetical protein